MIMRQQHPPSNFSLDDEYVTVLNFTPDLTLTRFRYMDASSEVQAPSVVRSRQGGGTDVIWRIVLVMEKTPVEAQAWKIYMNIFWEFGERDPFWDGEWKRDPKSQKLLVTSNDFRDRKITAWNTWRDFFG